MKRDLDVILGAFYAIERKIAGKRRQETQEIQEEIYKKVDKSVKTLLDEFIAMTVKNEYEKEKRLITFIYTYFDLFDEM